MVVVVVVGVGGRRRGGEEQGFGFIPLLHPASVALSWCARDGSRWTSLPDGFRFSGDHVRSQYSDHWPKIVSNQAHKREFPGVGDNQRVHKESHQFAPDPGSIPTSHARWLTRRCPDSKKRWRRWGISKSRSWRSTSGFPRGIGARRFEKSSRIVQDVVRRSPPSDGVVFTPTITCGQHGDVNFKGNHCLHQWGYLGCRVGEAPTQAQYRHDRQGG